MRLCVANFLFVLALALAPGVKINVAMAQSGAHGDGHAQYHDIYKDWQRPDVGGPCCNAASSNDPNGDCLAIFVRVKAGRKIGRSRDLPIVTTPSDGEV